MTTAASHGSDAPVGMALPGLVIAVASIGDTLLYAVLPLYHEDFGVSLAMVGVLLLMGGNLTLSYAEKYVASGLAALIIAVTPLWFLVLDSLLLGDHHIAVRGKVDTTEWARVLPVAAVADAGAVQIYVLHDVKALDLNPAAAGFHVVVSGHSHKFGRSERSGVLYVNPGGAGARRFRLPITVARLELGTSPWDLRFIEL